MGEGGLMNTDGDSIRNRIYAIRNVLVMLDSDLAEIYGVETRVFNQAVKRNIERFPEKFRFQLTDEEYENLRSQIVISSSEHGGRRYLPYAFTEQGVSMLSAVLRSKTAIEVSIKIIDAFVQMRHFIRNNAEFFSRLDSVEQRQIRFEMETTENFEKIFNALESGEQKPKQGIFFDGELFDAYTFVSGLVRSAERSIDLIDNYVDDTVLVMLSKRKEGVSATIYTQNITRQLKLDLRKHNSQYAPVEVKRMTVSHDRFLILDREQVYHIGASLKDLGKKWFAFSKMDKDGLKIVDRLKELR
jgi:hypothetical protein